MKGTASDEIMKSILRGCWLCSASKSNHSTSDVLRTFVVHIKLSNQGHGFVVGSRSARIVCRLYKTLKMPGQTSNRGTPWVRWSSQCCLCASCQPLGNLLAGEIQRLDSKAAGPCSQNAPNPNAFDSAGSVLAFPDFLIARLLHVSADKRREFYVILKSFEG
jgi:hypothetical protein